MRTYPIIFSAVMVSALLHGRKSQTRRLGANAIARKISEGDRLWVKETFCLEVQHDALPPSYMQRLSFKQMPVWFFADGPAPNKSNWGSPFGRKRSSIHMPKWASRITLEVREVSRQPLQSLTREDALEEGVVRLPGGGFGLVNHFGAQIGKAFDCPVVAFAALWDNLNTKDGCDWASNPDVISIKFFANERNINAYEEIAA